MSKTPADISAAIRATLALTIPGLSCEIGTPERKIIDAVSEAVSEAYIDQYLVGSLLDIDTKSGLELEQFVGIFGFGRLAGKRAQGTMRVTVNTASTQDQTFPAGTQFYTQPGIAGLSKTIYFSSKQAVVLVAGNTACDIPVEAQDPGSQANLPPDSITYVGNMIGGSSCTNLTAMTGGVDQETDPELRQRFKDTLLRNVAGTHDFYEALCQQNDSVSRVVVFGPVRLYSTQIEVPDTNLTLPVNQDVKYAWPGQVSVFTNLGQEDETFFSPVDDYTFVGGTSPSITRLSDNLTVGDVVDLEFQYTTKSSRNDPVNGITNKVDIFVDGISPYSIREACVIPSAALSADSLDPLYTGNFRRVGSAGDPTEGNRFMRDVKQGLDDYLAGVYAAGQLPGPADGQRGGLLPRHALPRPAGHHADRRNPSGDIGGGVDGGRSSHRHRVDGGLRLQPHSRATQRRDGSRQAGHHRCACPPGGVRLHPALPDRGV